MPEEEHGRGPSAAGLHFTVGSAAGYDSPERLNLREDLALVKASLLYADRVKLCSVGSSLLSGIAEYQGLSAEDRAKLVVKFLPKLQPSMTPREIYFFEAAFGLRGRREERRVSEKTYRELLGMVEEQQEELEAMVLEQHRDAGIEGFREAVDSGALEIHPFRRTSPEALVEAMTHSGGDLSVGLDLADLLEEFIEQVTDAVEDGSTYPLFDDLTGEFIAEAIRHGFVSVSEAGEAQGRHGGLSRDLLQRLPLFEEAKLSEVLAIRRELERPLRGFRTAVADFSREIRSAAWQAGFSEEAENLFQEKVEPEVERIEEAVRENRSLREFAWRTAYHGAIPTTFGAFIGSADNFAGLSGLALGLGSGAGRALMERRVKDREIRGNQLYFYYRAGEMLRG